MFMNSFALRLAWLAAFLISGLGLGLGPSVTWAAGLDVARIPGPSALDEGMSAQQQLVLALRYLNGDGVAHDPARGLTLMQRAAERGLAAAQSNLGVFYAKGWVVPASERAAAAWFHKAALGGSVEGQLNLGLAYVNGLGVKKDGAEAFKWFLMAARQGSPKADFNLGVACLRGDGVPQNTAEARRWFTLAAELGYEPAREMLATNDDLAADASTEPKSGAVTP